MHAPSFGFSLEAYTCRHIHTTHKSAQHMCVYILAHKTHTQVQTQKYTHITHIHAPYATKRMHTPYKQPVSLQPEKPFQNILHCLRGMEVVGPYSALYNPAQHCTIDAHRSVRPTTCAASLGTAGYYGASREGPCMYAHIVAVCTVS
jgi:hypothetical protein